MEKVFDVIVVGGGSMGAAAAYYLAKANQRVAVIDRETVPNDQGSHHGQTRMLRFGYSEGESYVPLVQSAYRLWRELERESGQTLYIHTGALLMGEEGSDFIDKVMFSSTTHDLPHEWMSANEIMTRWPGLNLPENYVGVLDTMAGFLLSEECVRVYKELAENHGAIFYEQEQVMEINADENQVQVTTAHHTLQASRLVVTAGAWTHELLPTAQLPIKPVRKTFGWFQPKQEGLYESTHFPCVVFDTTFGLYYGFPDYQGKGFKLGRHDGGQKTTPDQLNRTFGAHIEDERELRQLLNEFVPEAAGSLVKGGVCIYDQSPDEDFILDRHPTHSHIIFAGGFSGHGFKFASVVGKILSEMALDQPLSHSIDSFKLSRFK
ncbi:N-methyl-L-tryptophan oxidase [Alkalicoccobacillus murimartini]|uniref:N-methyl-L-tryptophan oxidase n=1 Tax=Alkalicoccobacillus murimartini TaxID=171685 RepID=A0ABT9YIV2_9BACI|nr:N-methyl-L-tryptophan oxidase [Alkalicoccobacillus murimartini]MDQ0207790.1 N-methyl-L-tryptophan oxidase [Alkalicoccobacillus murimartini]